MNTPLFKFSSVILLKSVTYVLKFFVTYVLNPYPFLFLSPEGRGKWKRGRRTTRPASRCFGLAFRGLQHDSGIGFRIDDS
jgi:hypothetical protein